MNVLLLSLTMLALEPEKAELDLRDAEGKVLVSAEEILGYEWSSHTLILKKGVADRLGDRLRTIEKKLAVPFTVAVDGKPVYEGMLTTLLSSQSQSGVVLVVDQPQDEKAQRDYLQLRPGYPSPEFFKGKDPRGDTKIKSALTSSGKLIQKPHS